MIISPDQFRSVLAIALSTFGLLFVTAGFWRLMAFGIAGHAKTLAHQSAKLGQKAITDDISRVAQAAIQLTDSVNALLRTSAGIGAFLIFMGLVFLACSYALMFHVTP